MKMVNWSSQDLESFGNFKKNTRDLNNFFLLCETAANTNTMFIDFS